MDWLKEKIWDLGDVFDNFPSVFVISIITICIASVSPFVYLKILKSIANFQLFNTKPYFDLVINNYEVLKYGLIILPIAICLIGFNLAYLRYERLIYRYKV